MDLFSSFYEHNNKFPKTRTWISLNHSITSNAMVQMVGMKNSFDTRSTCCFVCITLLPMEIMKEGRKSNIAKDDARRRRCEKFENSETIRLVLQQPDGIFNSFSFACVSCEWIKRPKRETFDLLAFCALKGATRLSN